MPDNTTPFLLNLNPAYMDEPTVSNDEFLDSLDALGVWLRVLPAYDSLQRYAASDRSPAQRLSAIANIYLLLGAQLEDQAVSLVAFSVWSRDRDLPLADLFSRIFVQRQRTAPAGSYIQATHDRLKDGSRASVDARAFFGEVSRLQATELVEFFLGYRWRTRPSVKLMPREHLRVWTTLPGELQRICASFHNEKHNPRLAAAYNKLKHGPQLVVQSPLERARRFATSGNVAAELAGYDALDKPGVRLLLSGARTAGVPAPGGARSNAPFLIDDEGTLAKLVFETMVYHATLLNLIVKMEIALYRKTAIDLDYRDEAILRIVAEADAYAKGHYRHPASR